MKIKSPLEEIPGVGESIAKDLNHIGIYSVKDLRGQTAERLYQKSNDYAGTRQDPCLLYVFRCAIYYAETAKPDPVKLKWWYWKDKEQTYPKLRKQK